MTKQNRFSIKAAAQTAAFAALAAALFCALGGCAKPKSQNRAIAVFVPGMVAGSACYEMLRDGVTTAASEYNAKLGDQSQSVKVDVIEAGTNQAEWGAKLTALAAAASYDLIVSSNSSLPSLVAPLTEKFPAQKFLLLDAYLEGNANVATVNYNQREQGYITGYAAGLATTAPSSELPCANPQKKIALVAAQEYPVLNDIIIPAVIEGAKAVDSEIELELRIVGNWYDAAKSAEIARSLYQEGVDVILPIAGGANQGVISAAQSLGMYVTWFDENGYAKAPGYIVSSTEIMGDKMAREMTAAYLEGALEYGKPKTVGMEDGYVRFVGDDAVCLETVPQSFREKLLAVEASIKSGALSLPMGEAQAFSF